MGRGGERVVESNAGPHFPIVTLAAIMDEETLAVVGATTGLIGGVAGVASLLWTVVWSLTLRPRVRWSFNRFEVVRSAFEEDRKPPRLRFYFRNVGTIAADDAHALIKSNSPSSVIEYPSNGRMRVEPGQELTVDFRADYVAGRNANRRYASGDDSVFALEGVRVIVRWRRQTLGLARRWFWLNKAQTKVPYT